MSAVKLVSTKEMSREEWLQWRNRGIGSSDAPVAIGMSRYKSPLELWMEKTGRKMQEDISNKDAVFWGTTLEPIVANVYAEKTGKKVRRVNSVLQHPDYPFMLANLDRIVEGGGVLEIKTAGLRSQGQWEEGVPLPYQIQVLHQLAVTGKAWADVAVLIGGQEFRIYRIERDEERIAQLVELETAFWNHVEQETAPEVDGSESSDKALALLYPRTTPVLVDYSERKEMNTLFKTLLEARQRTKTAELHEALLEQRVKEAIGNAEGALFSQGKAMWKLSKPSRSLDTKKLTQEYPELTAPYWYEKPGSRRFTVQEGD
ncbi:YqaJ viral recombinase family nuclease [Acidithiobacillus ferriphilus]|uniref:YqaJ viral recombinase family nuclease n=1 Tax=Acidithiobacillus ferriphilus TaxID=1689834 RepID=UPI002DBC4251|nr:YqaJ viral recombinase family protein [Acidithiobacillus ferriphilus]MEB8535194.1 YqaJ viral recombinase family protein [Acidithiobacillus ferriphilus]